jgi:hypothetical protein
MRIRGGTNINPESLKAGFWPGHQASPIRWSIYGSRRARSKRRHEQRGTDFSVWPWPRGVALIHERCENGPIKPSRREPAATRSTDLHGLLVPQTLRHHWPSWEPAIVLTRSAFTTLPVGVTGISERRKISDGRLYGARWRAANAVSSSIVTGEFGES